MSGDIYTAYEELQAKYDELENSCKTMPSRVRLSLATYIADYLNEELSSGKAIEVDALMVQDAIEAWEGGAADEGESWTILVSKN